MPQPRFVLGAFDHEQWCQVLQTLLPVNDPAPLREFLSGMDEDDPELEQNYILDEDQVAAIIARLDRKHRIPCAAAHRRSGADSHEL